MQCVKDVSWAKEAVLAELRVSWAFRSRQALVESRYWARTVGEQRLGRDERRGVMNGVGRKAQMSVVPCSSQCRLRATSGMRDLRRVSAFLIMLLTSLHSLRNQP